MKLNSKIKTQMVRKYHSNFAVERHEQRKQACFFFSRLRRRRKKRGDVLKGTWFALTDHLFFAFISSSF